MSKPAAADEPVRMMAKVGGEILVDPAYEFFSTPEIAAILGVSRIIVLRLIRQGAMKAIKHGDKGPWRISLAALRSYEEAQGMKAALVSERDELERLRSLNANAARARKHAAYQLRRRLRAAAVSTARSRKAVDHNARRRMRISNGIISLEKPS